MVPCSRSSQSRAQASVAKLVLAMPVPCQPRAAGGQIQELCAPVIYPSVRGTHRRNEIGAQWLILGSLAAVLASLPFPLQIKPALNPSSFLGHALQMNLAQTNEPDRKIWLFQAFLKSWDTPREKTVCEAGVWELTISRTLSLSRRKKSFLTGRKKGKKKKKKIIKASCSLQK